MTKIYVLRDEHGMIRYVGKTNQPLSRRFRQHLYEAKRGDKNYRCKWLRSMLEKAMLPEISSVAETDDDGSKEEISWIAFFKKAGVNLTNGTDGGEGGGGMRGHRHSEDTRRKMSAVAKGRVISKGVRQKLRAANLGKLHPHTEETKRKISASAKGRKFSEETLQKMRLAAKGRTFSEETRRKLREAQAARRAREALMETEKMKKLLSVLISVLVCVTAGFASDYAKFGDVSVESTTYRAITAYSVSGTNWTQTSATVPTGAGGTLLLYKGKLWWLALDGSGNSYSSSDGVTWSLSSGAGPNPTCGGKEAVVFNNAMWVMGGTPNGSSYPTDVFYSTDGTNWSTSTTTPGWEGRAWFGLAEHNGLMFVHCGANDNGPVYGTNIWATADGTNWYKTADDSSSSAVYAHRIVSFNGSLWSIGGNKLGGASDDVYYSSDNGTNWYSSTLSPGFTPRMIFGVVTNGGKMWVYGGAENWKNTGVNDVWSTSDGTNWTMDAASSAWGLRYNFGAVVYNHSMWVVGGENGSGYMNDTWKAPDTALYTNSAVSVNGSGQMLVPASIVPASSNTYDLGSAAYPWKDLYLSTNSIYMGGVKVLKYNSTLNQLEPQVSIYSPTGVTNSFDGLLVNTMKANGTILNNSVDVYRRMVTIPNDRGSTALRPFGGTVWTNYNTATNYSWLNICWSPELRMFAAVAGNGTGNRAMTSPDGITWTSRTTPEDNYWNSICWSPELRLFVSVAMDGTSRVMTSPNGTNWTARMASDASGWDEVCWSPELRLFVAVAGSGAGNRVMTSPDGINWTGRAAAAANGWRGLCWSPELGLFAAIATSGSSNRVMTSPDGINWTIRTSPEDNDWRSICWSPELRLFVAIAQTGTMQVMTSPDGINWTGRTAASSEAWFSVCWSPELRTFVAIAYDTGANPLMTSSDGINWTSVAVPSRSWRSICWSPELRRFVGVGAGAQPDEVLMSSESGAYVSGSFLPSGSNTVDIGSAALPFRDLYVGSNSIWMAGQKMFSVSNGQMVVGLPVANTVGVPYADSNTVADIEGANSGFDSQYTTTMTWNRGTRTLTLTPTGSVFYVNSYGVRRSYTNATTTIPDAEGIHFIYFDQNGALTNSQTAWTITAGEAQVSIIQWDADNNTELLFAEERHGNDMSMETHANLHKTRGAQWDSTSGGTLIRNTLTTGAPSADGSNTVVSITPCTILDEDVTISLGTNSMRMGSQTSVVNSNSAAWFPVTYASGNPSSFVWRGKTPDPWPFPYSGNVPQYNQLVGGTNWTLTAVTEDNYYVMWIFATDSYATNAYYIVPHHTIYAALNTAQSGATPETIFANRNTGLAPEIKLMYRLIYLLNASGGGSYSTAVKSSRLNDVVDYRTDNTRPLNNAPTQSHGALTGLANDDHPQYLLRSEQIFSYTLSLQDPTNGLAYWMPNPFGTRSCTLTRIYAKTHGMTGAVDIVSQHETDGWYTYSSITNGVAATATGTAQTSFTGSTAVTNGMRIGFLPSGLSAFAATNMVSVDFTFTIP